MRRKKRTDTKNRQHRRGVEVLLPPIKCSWGLPAFSIWSLTAQFPERHTSKLPVQRVVATRGHEKKGNVILQEVAPEEEKGF